MRLQELAAFTRPNHASMRYFLGCHQGRQSMTNQTGLFSVRPRYWAPGQLLMLPTSIQCLFQQGFPTQSASPHLRLVRRTISDRQLACFSQREAMHSDLSPCPVLPCQEFACCYCNIQMLGMDVLWLQRSLCPTTKGTMHAQAIDFVSTERSIMETLITIRKCESIEPTGAHCAILKTVNIYIIAQSVWGCLHQSLQHHLQSSRSTSPSHNNSYFPSSFQQLLTSYSSF